MSDTRSPKKPPSCSRRTAPPPGVDWSCADRLSDLLIDVLNAERSKPDFDPLQAIAAQLVALVTSIKKEIEVPCEVEMVMSAAKFCLVEMARRRQA